METQQALMLLVITAGAFLVPLVSERIGWFTAPCEMLYGALGAPSADLTVESEVS